MAWKGRIKATTPLSFQCDISGGFSLFHSLFILWGEGGVLQGLGILSKGNKLQQKTPAMWKDLPGSNGLWDETNE